MSKPTRAQQLLMQIAGTRPGAWLASRLLPPSDRALLRLTNGRRSLATVLGALPIVTLTATGARSGQPRSVPLIGVPDGDNVILIASNWGKEDHPAWYHNLRAHPEVTLTVDGQKRPYRARVLAGAEREAAWARAEARYPGYAAYRRRAEREIPVVLLEPR